MAGNSQTHTHALNWHKTNKTHIKMYVCDFMQDVRTIERSKFFFLQKSEQATN